MYKRDQPAIRAYVDQSADAFEDMLQFVVLSIRVPFKRLRQHVRETRAGSRAHLWGFKAEAFADIAAKKSWLWLVKDNSCTVATIDRLIYEIKGLGMVKAGFVAQMLGHDVACFDTRNLQALEMPSRSFREWKRGADGAPTMRPETRARHIEQYITMTRDTGGAAHWWDTWCNDLAAQSFTTGDKISQEHVYLITGKGAHS